MPPLTPDTDRIATLLDALTPLGGLPGHEGAVAAHMADALRATASDVHIDRTGNLIARYGPADAARKIAVLAHMDTVGLLVKQVDAANGMLRVMPVGGVNVAALPGAAVTVWDHPPGDVPRQPGLPGVIGVRSQHLARPGDAPTDASELYVQVDPAAATALRVTTPVTYAPQTIRQGDLYSSPHLDNRAGCAVLLALGAWLSEHTPPADRAVYLVGTVQEETTCAGALSALRATHPDVALFVDGTLSYDTPATRDRGAVRLGRGPVLTAFLYTSGLNGWHADPLLRAALCDVAHDQGIPYQEDAIRGLMSDARTATMLGIPSAIVGIPMRGKHAPLETLHLGDVLGTVQLVAAALGEGDGVAYQNAGGQR
jgi:endoglucanase